MAESKYFPDLTNGVDMADVQQVETAFTAVESDVNALNSGKVDKETGKGLSSNDYTTAEKNLVATIPQKADKSELPTKVSELENDSGYLTEHQSLEAYIKKAEAFDKLCPRGSAESLTSSLTLADCCGGTNVRNYVIHGAEGGVGDLNSGTGKYEIPVTVRGKNLLARVETRTDNGITYDLNADRWIMNGSASTNSYIPISTTQAVNLKPGTYTVSYTYISGTMDSAASAFYLGLRVVGTGNWLKDLGVSPRNYKTKITASFTLTEEKRGSWYSVGVGTVKNLTFAMQIEKGSEATDFEPYTAPKEYAISLDAPLGTGEVLTRETGGDITLTDARTNIIEVGTATAPGKIEVEYYKDINKVLANLNNAILSQGGNV